MQTSGITFKQPSSQQDKNASSRCLNIVGKTIPLSKHYCYYVT